MTRRTASVSGWRPWPAPPTSPPDATVTSAPPRCADELRSRTWAVLDAAVDGGDPVPRRRALVRPRRGVPGRLARRPPGRAVEVGSKWGYRYVGDWRIDADVHEVKDHSLEAFLRPARRDPSAARRPPGRLPRAQRHARDRRARRRPPARASWPRLRDAGVAVGISTSGPAQADAVRRALEVEVDGAPLFTSFQSTWNLLETSVAPALADAAAPGARCSSRRGSRTGGSCPARTTRRRPRTGRRGRRAASASTDAGAWPRRSPSRGRARAVRRGHARRRCAATPRRPTCSCRRACSRSSPTWPRTRASTGRRARAGPGGRPAGPTAAGTGPRARLAYPGPVLLLPRGTHVLRVAAVPLVLPAGDSCSSTGSCPGGSATSWCRVASLGALRLRRRLVRPRPARASWSSTSPPASRSTARRCRAARRAQGAARRHRRWPTCRCSRCGSTPASPPRRSRPSSELLGGPAVPAVQLALPIGISFFTFHHISYVVDVYRGSRHAQRNPVAVRHLHRDVPAARRRPDRALPRDRRPARTRRDRDRLDDFAAGFPRFALGLTKKVLIADSLAPVADAVLRPARGPARRRRRPGSGVLAYTLQIYFDFSGYSDMAIGLGRMLGFRLPENFDRPYSAVSITDFWRRWHMSLSRWFRDYVYIPLGGNRGTSLARPTATCSSSSCSPASGTARHWTFVVWGLFHGVLLAIERATGLAPRVRRRSRRVAAPRADLPARRRRLGVLPRGRHGPSAWTCCG